MCGIHTEETVLPKPTPKPAESARFATRIFADRGSNVEAGQRGRIRSISDLRINQPTLSSE